ncbi:MAG TPA: hypothetical protein VFS44_13045 [Gemmatimonadaceae bacterium]|nr:hypothetical protein [Gemmatimonadaceae bacterium]
MTSPAGRRRPRRSSGVERIFEDDAARLWSAGRTITPQGADALLFSCISDSRESTRAIAIPPDFRLPDVRVEELRTLLRSAPRVGTL